jgi:hypothetical protein
MLWTPSPPRPLVEVFFSVIIIIIDINGVVILYLMGVVS